MHESPRNLSLRRAKGRGAPGKIDRQRYERECNSFQLPPSLTLSLPSFALVSFVPLASFSLSLFSSPLPLFLSSLRSSSIPEIGQKSNRVTDVNGNVGGVHLGRRRIQQICSLTSELVRLNGSEEERENLDDAMGQKNSPRLCACARLRVCVCMCLRFIVLSHHRIDFPESPELTLAV